MKKPSRNELVYKVVRLAGLPKGKQSLGYLDRNQLVHLIVFLEHLEQKETNCNILKEKNNGLTLEEVV